MDIYYFESVPSTNTTLLDLSKKGAKSWTVCWTSDQTGGRGYAGNKWRIDKNQNLAVSILIKNELSRSELIYFNQWACNVVHQYLSQLSDRVFIKWPNDIIVFNKKVCGILIETHKADNQLNIITGIGLNINQKDYAGLPKAGSLFTQTGSEYDIQEILSGLLTELEESYHLIENKEWNLIANHYNNHLFRKDEVSSFKSKDKVFNGIIRSVDDFGRLIVELEDGALKAYQHKEIELLY